MLSCHVLSLPLHNSVSFAYLRTHSPPTVSNTARIHIFHLIVNCVYFSRAKSERASRLRAMQARAKKGLLSPQETLMLAEEEEAAKADEGCVIS